MVKMTGVALLVLSVFLGGGVVRWCNGFEICRQQIHFYSVQMFEPVGLGFRVWCFKMCARLSNDLITQTSVCFLYFSLIN
jgi:hypothetical protein